MTGPVRAMTRRFPSTIRVIVALAAALILAVVLDGGTGTFLTLATAGSVAQYCATLGLVAVALALTMTLGELDLSVGSMAGVAGAIAVRTDPTSVVPGLLAALGFGLGFGLLQGLVITRLRISSVAVTLGGLLLLQGVTATLTNNSTLVFDDENATQTLNQAIGPVLTVRSAIVFVIVVVLGLVLLLTRWGRDFRAAGSERNGARVAGVRTDLLVTTGFGISGLLAALSGVLLSYNLGAASASSLSDLLVPALAAAILGGVKLSGGRGNPIGVVLGVATLGVLQSGLSAAGQPSQVQQLYVGVLLAAVALTDSTTAKRRMLSIAAWRSRPQPQIARSAKESC